jgi:hypothetical protein
MSDHQKYRALHEGEVIGEVSAPNKTRAMQYIQNKLLNAQNKLLNIRSRPPAAAVTLHVEVRPDNQVAPEEVYLEEVDEEQQ